METSMKSRLSEGQKDCLKLVHDGYEAKEIARKLLISPHAVVERLRAARRVLGVQTSREAARMFMLQESPHIYNRFVDNPVGIDPAAKPLPFPLDSPAQQESAAHAPQGLDLRDAQMQFVAHYGERPRPFPLPFPTSGRPRNDLSLLQTFGSILALAVALGLAGVAAIAIVGELSRLNAP
jgi:DNA-binding CsgD family transcriptional regulator